MKIREDIVRGYRLVNQDGNKLDDIIDTFGKETIFGGDGLYLRTSLQSVRDQYSSWDDIPDVIYAFNVNDVLTGDPRAPDSEITVRKAILIEISYPAIICHF